MNDFKSCVSGTFLLTSNTFYNHHLTPRIMSRVKHLINDVASARNNYLLQLETITEQHAQWKPDPESWNMMEITEHLFWAEQGGILGMWKTLHAIREGKMECNYDSSHKDMPIEKIIELTWQPKEKVPAVAAPRMGGTIFFWRESLKSLQNILEAFGRDIRDDELRILAHPHPISGAMDFHQRLEFLRFHIDRHRNQVRGLVAEMQ